MRWAGPSFLVLAGCATAAPPTAAERAAALIEAAPEREGDLELRCTPEDARVLLDGVPQGTCRDFDGSPARLSLGEGMHRVDVKKEGYRPYQTYYQPSGAWAVLEVELVPQENTGSKAR